MILDKTMNCYHLVSVSKKAKKCGYDPNIKEGSLNWIHLAHGESHHIVLVISSCLSFLQQCSCGPTFGTSHCSLKFVLYQEGKIVQLPFPSSCMDPVVLGFRGRCRNPPALCNPGSGVARHLNCEHVF